MTPIGFTRSTYDVCVYSPRSTAGNLEGILCVHVDDTICGVLNLRHRFPFRKWQVGEGMFCGSKYVQNKATKEILITQTEFAAKIVKIPMSAARKKMREYLAGKAETYAFRGVSGSVSWLAGQSRPDVSCQVSQLQQTLAQLTVAQVCASSVVVRKVHQRLDLCLKIRRVPVQNMILLLHVDASLNTDGLLAHRAGTSVVLPNSHCWMERVLHGLHSRGDLLKRVAQWRARWVPKHKQCLWPWDSSNGQRCLCRS